MVIVYGYLDDHRRVSRAKEQQCTSPTGVCVCKYSPPPWIPSALVDVDDENRVVYLQVLDWVCKKQNVRRDVIDV